MSENKIIPFEARRNFYAQSNHLLRSSSFDLGLTGNKLLAVLTANAQIKKSLTFTVRLKNLSELISGRGGNSYKLIDKELRALYNKEWTILIINQDTGKTDKEVMMRLVSSLNFNQKKGTVTIELAASSQQFLLQLYKQYAIFDLRFFLSLKSKYGPRLYQYFKSFSSIQSKIEMTIEEFTNQMHVQDNSYNYSNLKKYVLIPALVDVCNNTDLFVTFKEIKAQKGKKVEKLLFNIREKDKEVKYKLLSEIEKDIDLGTIYDDDNFNVITEQDIRASEIIGSIFDFWDKLPSTQKCEFTDKIGEAIHGALKRYDIEDLKSAMRNYNEMLTAPWFVLDYQWSLSQFLRLDKIERVQSDGQLWTLFLKITSQYPEDFLREMMKDPNKKAKPLDSETKNIIDEFYAAIKK